MEREFVGHWQRYQQVLKQRNAALKARQPKAIVSAWDIDLVRSGELLSAARERYVTALEPYAAAVGRSLLGMELNLDYRQGWAKDLALAEAAAAVDRLVHSVDKLVVYVCGGGDTVNAVRDALVKKGMDRKSVKWEKFW